MRRGWRRSTTCNMNACVELNGDAGPVSVRDTEDREGALLQFDRAVFGRFLLQAKGAAYDTPGSA